MVRIFIAFDVRYLKFGEYGVRGLICRRYEHSEALNDVCAGKRK